MKHPKTKPTAKKASLVTNGAAGAEGTATVNAGRFIVVTATVNTSLVRNDKMEGRDYVVVPMVMITEGVLNGSNGPLLYTADELSKTPQSWNHKPVIVYHHSKDGTACNPEILSSHKIGVIMNTKWDAKKKRLVAEAWLEPDRVKEVDNRVWEAIQNKEMLELSTGLFTDNEMVEGEFNGTPYIAIARNYRPDHLAVLPDQKGACSIEDGAGFIRNELRSAFTEMNGEDIELLRDQVIKGLRANKSPAVRILLTNEASHEQVREALYRALEAKYPPKDGYACPWIEAVFDDAVIYALGGALFKVGYSMKEATAKLEGEPTKVVRQTEYRTVTTANSEGSSKPKPKTNKENAMDKKQIVDGLIANHGYKEDDRAWLMGLDEAALKRINETAVANAKAPKTETPKVETPKVENTAPKVEAPKLSDEDQAALNYGKRQLAENKAKLIATITANKANKFTAEQLNSKSIDELEGIAALAAVPTAPAPQGGANYVGQGGVAAPSQNADQVKPEDALPTPSMNWEADGKK